MTLRELIEVANELAKIYPEQLDKHIGISYHDGVNPGELTFRFNFCYPPVKYKDLEDFILLMTVWKENKIEEWYPINGVCNGIELDEDKMLIHRIMIKPEREVFKIEL